MNGARAEVGGFQVEARIVYAEESGGRQAGGMIRSRD